MERIIFLDIDGVLNSESYFNDKTTGAIDPECAKKLNRIIKETNADGIIHNRLS